MLAQLTPEPSIDHCSSTLQTYTYLTFNGQIINGCRWNETNLNDILIEEDIQICTKFSDLWDVKIEKKYVPKKNNYTIRQYLYGLVISLYPRSCMYVKNTRYGSTIFFLKTKYKKPEFPKQSFSILRTRFTMGYKRVKNLFRVGS